MYVDFWVQFREKGVHNVTNLVFYIHIFNSVYEKLYNIDRNLIKDQEI